MTSPVFRLHKARVVSRVWFPADQSAYHFHMLRPNHCFSHCQIQTTRFLQLRVEMWCCVGLEKRATNHDLTNQPRGSFTRRRWTDGRCEFCWQPLTALARMVLAEVVTVFLPCPSPASPATPMRCCADFGNIRKMLQPSLAARNTQQRGPFQAASGMARIGMQAQRCG